MEPVLYQDVLYVYLNKAKNGEGTKQMEDEKKHQKRFFQNDTTTTKISERQKTRKTQNNMGNCKFLRFHKVIHINNCIFLVLVKDYYGMQKK